MQQDICNGCGYCVPACPYGVIDQRKDDGRVFKCTMCYDRLTDGLMPACATACPTQSIQFGDLDELQARADARLATLQSQGVESARLYGRDENDGVGGAGAFFLLLDEPEVYGLPPDPVVTTRDLPAMWRAAAAGAAMIVGVALSAIVGSEALMTEGIATPGAGLASGRRRLRTKKPQGQAATDGGAAGGGPPARSRWSTTPSSPPTTGARSSSRRCGRPRTCRCTCSSGGAAGSSAVLGALADLTGRPALTRAARLVAGGGAIASVVFLIHDLGRPERFLHMLRVFKPTSPLSVGSYILSPFSAATGATAAVELLGWFPRLKRFGGIVGGAVRWADGDLHRGAAVEHGRAVVARAARRAAVRVRRLGDGRRRWAVHGADAGGGVGAGAEDGDRRRGDRAGRGAPGGGRRRASSASRTTRAGPGS